MTRKDYVLIAKAVQEAQIRAFTTDHDYAAFVAGVHAVVQETMRVLAEDNPRFNRERFAQACGLACGL
jgi:hypothetical protein